MQLNTIQRKNARGRFREALGKEELVNRTGEGSGVRLKY